MCKMSAHKDLSLSEKVDLLDKIRSQPKGTSRRHLVELLKVPKTTIGRLLRQEVELRGRLTEKGKARVSLGKRQRRGKDPEVEEALEQWFAAVLEKG